jgi:hypothetical protein
MRNNPVIFTDSQGTQKEPSVTSLQFESEHINLSKSRTPGLIEFEARRQERANRLYGDLLIRLDQATSPEERTSIFAEVEEREGEAFLRAAIGFYGFSIASALAGIAGAAGGTYIAGKLGLGAIGTGALSGASAGISDELTRGLLFIGVESEFARKGIAGDVTVESLAGSAFIGGIFGVISRFFKLRAERLFQRGPAQPSSRSNVLLVGAERDIEFQAATRLQARGHNVTVVNPKITPEVEAFKARGGNFIQGRIQDLPPEAKFNLVHENFPQPIVDTPAGLAETGARFSRVNPGGRARFITEESAHDLRRQFENVGAEQGFTVRHRVLPSGVGPELPPYPRLQGQQRYLTVVRRPKY